MGCLRVLLCLAVVLVGGAAPAAGPRCDEAKRAAVSAAARCDVAARQCQRTKTDADCTRATNICEAAMALAEKMADVCSTTEAAADAPQMCAGVDPVALATSDCDDWSTTTEDERVCMARNEKGICMRWGEKTCTFEIKCCEREGHPSACYERNRKCGPVRPI